MSFIGIAINIWIDTLGGGEGVAPEVGLRDAQGILILDAQGAVILDAQNN